MKLTTSVAVALAVAPAMAVPPASFGFPTSTDNAVVDVAYRQTNGSYVRVQPGSLFGVNVPEAPPVLALNTTRYASLANYTGQYLGLVVDPDASYPENPQNRFILHYLQPNLTLAAANATNATLATVLPAARQLVNATAAIAPYNRPRPPTNSSAHRYIFYVFRQAPNFTIPEAYAGYNAQNRSRFNLTAFVAAARLGTPVAANYFYASNQSNVPVNFVASPNGTYPSGNGNAVTSGDPGATAVRTSSPSPTTNAAAMVTGMGGIVGAGLVGLAALL